MSKAHRGKGIRALASRGRGTCARCQKDNIKVLYEQEIDGAKAKVCKYCNAAIKNAKAKEPPAAPAKELPVEPAPEASE